MDITGSKGRKNTYSRSKKPATFSVWGWNGCPLLEIIRRFQWLKFKVSVQFFVSKKSSAFKIKLLQTPPGRTSKNRRAPASFKTLSFLILLFTHSFYFFYFLLFISIYFSFFFYFSGLSIPDAPSSPCIRNFETKLLSHRRKFGNHQICLPWITDLTISLLPIIVQRCNHDLQIPTAYNKDLLWKSKISEQLFDTCLDHSLRTSPRRSWS